MCLLLLSTTKKWHDKWKWRQRVYLSFDLTCRDSRKMRWGRSPVWSSLPSVLCWVHQHSWWWWGHRDQDNSSQGDACTCTNMFPSITLYTLRDYITFHILPDYIAVVWLHSPLAWLYHNRSWMHYLCINLAYTRLHNTWHIAWYITVMITPSTWNMAWLF